MKKILGEAIILGKESCRMQIPRYWEGDPFRTIRSAISGSIRAPLWCSSQPSQRAPLPLPTAYWNNSPKKKNKKPRNNEVSFILYGQETMGAEPGDFAADTAGGAGDNAGEIVGGRQRQRVLQVAGNNPLEQHFVYQIHPPSQPFNPSQRLFLPLLLLLLLQLLLLLLLLPLHFPWRRRSPRHLKPPVCAVCSLHSQICLVR